VTYLLDTNVVSELRRAKPHGAVTAWLQTVPDDELNISAVTIGEIQAGIEITRELDEARATEIGGWLERVLVTFNILDMDARAFRVWARLMHKKPPDLIEDAMIAATAVTRGLTVVTRNVRDFKILGVPTLNPFESRR
jgi:predicted nucleic acid-binding protein